MVLGGAGGVGRVAVEALTHLSGIDEVVVCDLDVEAAAQVTGAPNGATLRPMRVDVSDPDSLDAALVGAQVVLNCVGPFYRFGPPTLEAAIRCGVGYVDICDDLDATQALLAMDADARAAGVTALVGMGNSPGLANIFVKLCSEQLFDEITSADIAHVHGGEPSEGAAVLKHRIHAMVDDVPLYIDGEFIDVRQLEESGEAFVHDEDFPGIGPFPVYPYPHPETITLPATFPSLRRVTNMGSVYPLSYFHMTQDLVRSGMALDLPLDVGGVKVAPLDVMVALIQHARPALLSEAGIDGPGGCLRVTVGGIKDGEHHTYVCSLRSEGAGAGEGTGIPAALGAAMHARGELGDRPGVFAPEALVPVDRLLELAGEAVTAMNIGGGGGMPLTVEHVAPDGTRVAIPMALG